MLSLVVTLSASARSNAPNNHVAVMVVRKYGLEKSIIFKTLQPFEISRTFMYLAVELFEEIWKTNERSKSGRPLTVSSLKEINALETRIQKSPIRNLKKKFLRDVNIKNIDVLLHKIRLKFGKKNMFTNVEENNNKKNNTEYARSI